MTLTELVSKKMMEKKASLNKEAGALVTGSKLLEAAGGSRLGQISKKALLDASRKVAENAMKVAEKAQPATAHQASRLDQLWRAAYNRAQRLNALGLSKALEGGMDANTNFDALNKLVKWNNTHNSGIKALNKLTGDEAQSLIRSVLGKNPY